MKRFLKLLLLLFLIIVSVMVYARFIGTMGFITKEYTIKNNNLPTDFDGLKIVHISDIHYNRAININKIDKIVAEINLINPDIVVFTGDLIDRDVSLDKDKLNELEESLRNIDAKLGKYAVLGNHDHEKNTDDIIKLLKLSEFKLLNNTSDIIYSKNNQKLFIGGLDSITSKKHDIDKMIEDTDLDSIPYKIVLVHEPDITDELIKYNINLVLAGHSLNGQVRLPIIGPLYTPDNAKKYYEEHYKIDNTDLYISSGIGVSTFNYRLFNHPSINFYRINKN